MISSIKPGVGFPVTVMQSVVIDPLLGNRLCTCEFTVIVLFSIYCPSPVQRDLEICVLCMKQVIVFSIKNSGTVLERIQPEEVTIKIGLNYFS